MNERRSGLLAGATAYGLWGLFPIYFKALATVPPLEILSHRVAWALLLLVGLVRSREQMGSLRAALRGRSLPLLAASATMIALNWLVYLWAILTGRIVEASLGYFITPLVSILLGVVLLREPLERPLVVATVLAGVGVAWMTLELGRPPWIALALAVLFGGYGLLRKIVPVGAVVGLTVETLLLFPLAVGYMAWSRAEGRLAFLSGPAARDALLVASGPLTALPPRFSHGMFVGQHGSWNRKPRSGYKVLFVPFREGRPTGETIDLLTGFVDDDGKASGRPVGVAVDGRGGLLVADDVGNVVWRVSAAPATAAAR